MTTYKVHQYNNLFNEALSKNYTVATPVTIRNIAKELLSDTPSDYKEITTACFQIITEHYINLLRAFVLNNNQTAENLKKHVVQLIDQSPKEYKEINYAYLHVKYELIGQPLINY